MATLVPVLDDQYNRAYQLQYLGTNRPWLSLYGTRIRPVAPLGSTSRQPLNDPSLLHNLLPDELLYEIFVRMSPYTLGKAMCVCRKWRYAIRSPVLWRIACLKAWQMVDQKDNELILRKHYGCSWRKMWLLRPRLRFDGIYVSRNTYVRSGVIQWKSTKPAHLVCYYRYFRFFPNAKFLYKNSSSTLKDVAKTMQRRSKKENVYGGLYTLSQDQVEAAILYSGLRPTVLRMRVRIRGTCEGANNRLDMTLLVTSGVDENEARENEEEVLNTVENWQVNETHNPDVPAVSHSRGLSPFVFVPFEEVESSELNLPVEEMDFFIPG